VGRIHLVGQAPAGLSPTRRRGLRDLGIAIGAGALIWIGDVATGGHLAGAVNALAARLAVWFEDRREPVVTCEPGRPRPYTALEGVVLQAPACWEVEVVPLLDREVHRFRDPEARIGTLSVSVQPIDSEEDREDLEREFVRISALPGARIDGGPPGRSHGSGHPGARMAEEGDTPEGANPRTGSTSDPDKEGEVTGSAAERLLRAAGAAQGGDTASTSPRASRAFRRVEAGGSIGDPPAPGKTALQPDGTYAKRTWTWLLLGDREAVRIVYAVRADWSESVVVAAEFKRASALVDSVTPADR